jgi:hypothetical protein
MRAPPPCRIFQKRSFIGTCPIGHEPESLKQLLDALFVLRRRIDARAATGGTDAAAGAGRTLRHSRRDVDVDSRPIAP